jgi:hypothetical protein
MLHLDAESHRVDCTLLAEMSFARRQLLTVVNLYLQRIAGLPQAGDRH